jgi:hypothetical protein
MNFPNSEVEPSLAVDPSNPLHLVGAWQQDRWSNGAARGIVAGVSTDGGNTWTPTPLPGVTADSGGSALRASDPWVSIGPDGTIYVSYLEADDPDLSTPRGVFVSTSTNGVSWSNPVAVITNINPNDTNFFDDKPAITADPTTPGEAYIVWDRNDFAGNHAPALFSKTTDGGQHWTAPQSILDIANDGTVGNQIVVLPNGNLLDVTTTYDFQTGTNTNIVVEPLTKQGVPLSLAPVTVAALESNGVFDPNTGTYVRAGGDSLPEIAVDHNSGAIYVVWQDARFSNFDHDEIALSRSTDGGMTWSSKPAKVNQTPTGLPSGDEQAFTPAVAVAANGIVAVSYYDFRNNDPVSGLSTDAWVAFADPTQGLVFGNEQRLSASTFDLALAPNAFGEFLGDYQGLMAGGASFNNFGAFFAQAVSAGDPSSIFFLDAGPVINSIDPSSVDEGTGTFTLTVNGNDFFSNSTVYWNGAALSTTFVSGTQLTASVPAADVAEDGTASITVVNPAPSGGTSNAVSLSITEPAINGSSATLSSLVVGQAGMSEDVATFTHANGVEPAGDFMATVNWGIAGHTADAATITQDGSGTYHVTATPPVFSAANSYSVAVSISEDNASTTVNDTQVVAAADTTTSLTVTSATTPNAAFTYGNILTFKATVTANSPSTATVNTGTVSFFDGANLLATVNVNASGVATFSTTVAHPLLAGGHTITATYNANTNFNTSSDSKSVTVTPAPLWVTANSTSKPEGNTLTFAGTEFTVAGPAGSRTVAGPTGPILFDGDSVTSVTLSSTGAAAGAEDGSYAIQISNAVGSGLSNYAITYVPGTLTVLEPAINATLTSPATISEGDAGAMVEVATFTHANGVEDPSHFSAAVNWGIVGHTADAGTITQDGSGTYHVNALRPVFSEEGNYSLSVSVSDNDSAPTIGQNFAGLGASDDIALYGSFFIPPDQGSAVGPNHYMELINLAYAIYNKDGTVAVPRTPISTLLANAGVPGLGTGLSDPRIVYDPSSGHWFIAIITTSSNSNSIVVAVSQTSDPTGTWKAASFVANTTANNFADYPTIAVDANALYVASNNFLNGASFDGVSLTTIPKADLLNPAGPVVANRSHFENITGGGTAGTTPFTFAPVSNFGSRDHGVVLATDGFTPATVIHLYDVLNPGSNASTLSADNPLAVASYWNNQNAHQPDGSRTLNGGDFRFGSNSVYQVGNIIWVADSILTSATTGNGTYDAIRWYEIDESTDTVLQSGTISDPHHDYIYPSIAANAAGDVVIGFTASGDSTTSDYAGSWYVTGTTTGGVTTFSAPIVLRNGSSNYSIVGSGRNRWGDFSAISVDPTNPNAFWIADEAAIPGNPAFTTRTQLYGTQISEITFGNTATVSGTQVVTEPAIMGASATLPPVVVGQAGASVEVATFTHANGVEPAGDFTATVNWGIAGHTADAATITQDGSGTYHVTATPPVFSAANSYSVVVSISEDNASTTITDTQTVNKDSTTTTATASTFGQSVTFNATVTANAPGSGTPMGTVDFFDVTTSVDLGPATLSGGHASLTDPSMSVGIHTITVSYSGDPNFLASSTSITVTVVPSAYILDPKASGALSLSGNGSLQIGGLLIVDSSSKTALTGSGQAVLKAGSIQVVGGFSWTSSGVISPTPVTGVSPVADPLAGLPIPAAGASMGSINLGSGSLTINPGIYKSIAVSGSATLILSPGVYEIAGGGLSVSGSASIKVASGFNATTGHGVLIYNAGTNFPAGGGKFGSINVSGSGNINLLAPDQGVYAGIIVFQSRDNPSTLMLSGQGLGILKTGTIYAAAALVSISGQTSFPDSLVVDRLQISGSGGSSPVIFAAASSTGSTATVAGTLAPSTNGATNLQSTGISSTSTLDMLVAASAAGLAPSAHDMAFADSSWFADSTTQRQDWINWLESNPAARAEWAAALAQVLGT